MKSKIFSSKFLKTSMKGNAWIPALLSIGFLLAFPVAMLMVMGEWSTSGIYTQEQMAILYENLWVDGLMQNGLVAVVVAAVLNAFNGYFYLYSQRKVDFYHSLPMKRSHMFIQKLWMGILYYLIPYAVMEFLAVCVGAMRGYFSLPLMGMAVRMLLIHLVMYLFLYGAVVLVLVMTGNVLMGTLSGAALFLYGPALSLLIKAYEETFFRTSIAMYDCTYGIRSILSAWGSPISLCASFIRDYGKGSCTKALVLLLASTDLFLAAAYAAFLKRPVEKSGRALIFRFTEPLIKILVTVPFGLGVGIIFMQMRGAQAGTGWWIFGLIFGTILAHGAIEILYQRDYRKFASNLPQLLLCSVLVAAFALTVRFDWLGYDSYLPSYEKLEGLALNLSNLYMGDRAIGIRSVDEDGAYQRWIVDEDSGIMSYPVEMNQKIYAQLEEIVESNAANSSIDENADGSYLTYVDICYRLKSGRKIYREYTIDSMQGRNFIQACLEEGTLKEYMYSFLNIDDQYLKNINGSFADGSYCGVFDRDSQKREELMEALRADVAEADAEVLTEVPCANLGLEYEKIPLSSAKDSFGVRLNPYMDDYEYIFVFPGFKRTVALLEENGYALSLEDAPIEKVRVEIYDLYDGAAMELEFDEEEEIEQLKECLIPYTLSPGWLNTENSATAWVTGGWMQEESMRILAEKEPEFLKEAIEERKN